MRRLSARRCTAVLVAIGAAALSLPVLTVTPTQAAPGQSDLSITKTVTSVTGATKIDETQFIPGLKDVRAPGTYEFVDAGLRIRTTSTVAKVAQYWAYSGNLPSTASYTWTQDEGHVRPGLQIVFDADGILGNGIGDYNILVNAPPDNGLNWWLPPSASDMAKNAAPSCNPGGPGVGADTDPDPVRVCRGLVNGRPWYGQIGSWISALPNALVYAVGFTLGSGVNNTHSGVLTSMTYGSTTYTFGGFSSSIQAGPGETVEYQLAVKNGSTAGTVAADNVQVLDTLPAELAYVPGSLVDNGNNCAFVGQALTCNVGTVAPGATTTIRFRAEIDDELTTTTTGQVINQGHWIDVQKNETFADLPAGQTHTYSTYCPSGFVPTDGGLLVDAVDQGGSYADLLIQESRPSTQNGLRGWTVTTRNAGLHRGQGKVKVTCLGETVGSSDGHTHTITLAASTGTAAILPADPANASRTVSRTCPGGYTPVAPQYNVTQGSLVVLASRASANVWTWTVSHGAGTNATFDVSCLPPRTNTTQAHMSDLQVSTKADSVVLDAGTRGEGQIVCDNGGNGIVGGWDRVPPGPISLGMESRGNTYMFRFFNAQPASATATIQLACIGVRTADEARLYHVVNTATVSTTTPDSSSADDMSTTDVGVNMDATAAPNRGVTVDTTGTRTVVLSKTTTVNLNVKCPVACSFTARVYYGGQVVAKGPFSLAASPGWQPIQVPTTDAGTYQGPGQVTVRIKTANGTTTFKVVLG